ncbi:hypothetical protein HGRIS_002265 [Hohenbuehelia grisea]|uniref:histidine kinase n=1 Tax=Hohenbuehelia grisea TaxID=104357 RepID=A0ABR3JM05_9AGAR
MLSRTRELSNPPACHELDDIIVKPTETSTSQVQPPPLLKIKSRFTTDEIPLPISSPRYSSPKVARISRMSTCWTSIKRRIGTSTVRSSSSNIPESSVETRSVAPQLALGGDGGVVDAIVIDRDWTEALSFSSASSAHDASSVNTSTKRRESFGERPTNFHRYLSTPHASFCTGFLRWPLWPAVAQFFDSRFSNADVEHHFVQESWSGVHKRIALWSCLFLILNWMIGCCFTRQPLLIDIVFFYIVSPLVIFPLLLMILWDFPYKRSLIYQIFLSVAIWSWSYYLLFYIYFCGYYDRLESKFPCRKDFMGVFFFAGAYPALALFGLQMRRLTLTLTTVVYTVISCAVIIPIHTRWLRHIMDNTLFLATMLYIHFMTEQGERRLFTLRESLKAQFKTTQKAQVNERKAAESKRRLTSYVFHEVRVPLNTALLAVQNIEASSNIAKGHDIEFSALNSSLAMMSKVLDDVLDFNRMDSGILEFSSRPYGFHQAIRSLVTPLRMAAHARKLDFEVTLDPRIDEITGRAVAASFDEPYTADPTQSLVVGDETRLRQVITNLASNACKFTPPDGKVSISTQLIWPSSIHPSEAAHLERIVVRIEVTDNGYGINAYEMERSKLFSAFNQTERGRQQGGKGTGLGLALVRQIVKLSGGRLGVRSQVGKGSTFWVELPLNIGRKVKLSYEDTDSEVSAAPSEEVPVTPPIESLHIVAPSDTGSKDIDTLASPQGIALEKMPPIAVIAPANAAEEDVNERVHRPPTISQDSNETIKARFKSPLDRPPEVHSSPPSPSTTRPSLGNSASIRSSMPRRHSSASTVPTIRPPLNVLVVDDDPLTRMLMSRLLKRLGCTVSLAENGRVALDMILKASPGAETVAQELANLDEMPVASKRGGGLSCRVAERFDIIFLDNQMPVLSGPQAVEILRGMGRQDFVVGVTGNALLTDQEEYLKAGVNHVLTKPVMESSLRAMLAMAETRKKALRHVTAPAA